jgi:glycine/D-amino acid oxidase-like deaminating enzyme
MNGLNQIIAQGGRQLQLESPLNQLAQVEQIRQAQQTNALRQAQMQELERERSRTNALNQAYADAFDPTKGTFDQSKLIQNLATGGLGSQIPGVQKGLREAREAELKTEKARHRVCS